MSSNELFNYTSVFATTYQAGVTGSYGFTLPAGTFNLGSSKVVQVKKQLGAGAPIGNLFVTEIGPTGATGSNQVGVKVQSTVAGDTGPCQVIWQQ